MDFDVENFIAEIRNRPPIWNSKCPEYSDRSLRQKAWKDLVNVYGAELPAHKKRDLEVSFHKKWRNIRDCFVKTHKAKESKRGLTKPPYMFYDNLLFLKDTISSNATATNVRTKKERLSTATNVSDFNVDEAVNEVTQIDDSSNASWTPKRKKKNKNEDPIGRELIRILKNLEKKDTEADNDRLFFLSLVKEFGKIPESSQLRVKIDILKVIMDAQIEGYPNE